MEGLALAIALVSRWVCEAMACAKSVGENFSWLRAVGELDSLNIKCLKFLFVPCLLVRIYRSCLTKPRLIPVRMVCLKDVSR